jgi:hypothetical protein
MSLRARIASYGSAALLVIAGAVCAAVFGGEAAQIIGMVLIGLGLILVTALVFLEVGLGEDRERAREAHEAVERKRRSLPLRSPRPRLGRSAGLGRARDHPRRLR